MTQRGKGTKMVSVSDNCHDFDASQALRHSLRDASRVNRSGRVFLGTVLILSGIGLWVVPVGAHDPAMQLIKLFLTLVLAGLGAMFISSISERKNAPEIAVDTKQGELRVSTTNRFSGRQNHKRYALATLSDVSLKDQMFSARDADGALVVSLPIRDKATENALRSAFGMAA